MLMAAGSMRLVRPVAAKGRVVGDLLGRQNFLRREMVSQVRGAKLRLGFSNLGSHCLQAFRGDGLSGKLPIEMRLKLDNLLPQRNGLALQCLIEFLNLVLLLGRQLEFVGKLEGMQRTRVAVELGGKGKAHPASGEQVGDFLGGQRLDLAILKIGIWLRMLRQAAALGKKEANSGQDEESFQGGLPDHRVLLRARR
jgi:hypothetical protein